MSQNYFVPNHPKRFLSLIPTGNFHIALNLPVTSVFRNYQFPYKIQQIHTVGVYGSQTTFCPQYERAVLLTYYNLRMQ